jgi:hypothetical protein
MASGPVASGDWRNAIYDDFLNPSTPFGSLSWAAAAGAGGSNAAASAATQALCKFNGAVAQTVTTTVAGIAAEELTGMVLNNANGVGVEADCAMAVDTVLPTAAQNAAWLFGIFDSVGAVATGNFIGLMYGWNPITNSFFNGFLICADTVARLTGNTPTAQAVQIPLNVAPALDVPNHLRFEVNTAWTLIRGMVNGVAAFQQIGTAAQQSIYPNILVPANGIPNITDGWLGFKLIGTTGTSQTMKAIVDEMSYSLPGRVQYS